MDITTATPAEIDTTLAEIYGRYHAVLDDAQRHTKWIEDMEDGLAKFEAGNRSYSSYSRESLERLLTARDALWSKATEILEETRPFEREYVRRGGWSRFYLVQNNGGHIHSSQRCSTCFITTRFGWLPSVSGKTEAEAVAEFGAILCTVCYPTAPTEWTDRRDDSLCQGSGTWDYPRETARLGYYSGNYGVCEHCGGRVTVSKTGKMRKHKNPVA